MSLVLSEDAPCEVLAAFSRLADPPSATDGAALSDRRAPSLPAPHADWYDDSVLWEDPDPSYRPWLFDWSSYLSAGHANMYIASAKFATFAWTGYGWLLSFRTTIKAYPRDLVRGFAWLGEYSLSPGDEQPLLVGYLKHEYEERPWLAWGSSASPLTFENLNIPANHGLTDPDRLLLRTHMWRRTNEGNRRMLEAKLRREEPASRAADLYASELRGLLAMPADPPDSWDVPLEVLLAYRDRLWKETIDSGNLLPPPPKL